MKGNFKKGDWTVTPLHTQRWRGDQIYYLGCITNLNDPTPNKMVWNHCPYRGSFLSMNNSWVYDCPWSPERAGSFSPCLELTGDMPLTQAFWSLKVSTWYTLCSFEYVVSKVVHLFRQNKSPSQKNTTIICTHVTFVYMCGLWIGKGTERQKGCV